MKLISLVLALISFNSFACQNTLPESEVIKAISLEPGAGSKTCSQLPDEKCFCYDGIDWRSAELVDNEVVDFVRKEKAESCSSEEECISKLQSFVCDAGSPIRTEVEVYCAVEVMKIDGKKLVESPSKKLAKEQKEQQDAQLASAMGSALKAMDCGKSAQALMLVRNASKNLTTEQVKQIVAAYAPIKALLDTGSLQSAVEEIQAIVADGVLVTEADKIAIIGHINECRL